MKKIITFLIINSFIINLFAQMKPQDSNLNLMPWPKEVQVLDGYFMIDKNFTVNIEDYLNDNKKVFDASTRFIRNLANITGIFIDHGFANNIAKNKEPSLLILVEKTTDLKLEVDETYKLLITKNQIKINANTDIGALNGLNTLLQLLTVKNGNYIFPAVAISDAPRFAWRGLMIDAARHFMPVDVIKRNLDAMAYVKLNVFHWHLSDDQGFRMESKKLPLLTQKATDGQFYTQNQIKDIVKYAGDRGIRVIPEIDVPGHASAFLAAYPELASNKTRVNNIERFAGVFNPTLDPTLDKTYELLDLLFAEITPLFPDLYFHIGGDENEGKDWDESEEIQEFMKMNNLKNNHELQTYFNIKLQKILKKYGKILMGWDEIMTDDMPKNAIIHSWRGLHEGLPQSTLIEAAKKGYKTVLSNGFYIDRMLPASHYYATELIGNEVLTNNERANILGGEATMWSELVTPLNIDSRIWPRTAAIAERFWSTKETNDVDSMYDRMEIISNNLEYFGITHIRNKQVILRNISNYQNVAALNKLSNISEPFKVYSRNNGGKEYKSFSPFTLFADACNVDAKDVMKFNALSKKYLLTQDVNIKNEMLTYLISWKNIDNELKKISANAPIVENIMPYANRVSKLSSIFEKGLQANKFSEQQYKKVIALLEAKEDPKDNLDVTFAVSKSLNKLADFLVNN